MHGADGGGEGKVCGWGVGVSKVANRVLVIGGRGAFGSRLVEGILATTDMMVIIAGRNLLAGRSCAAEVAERFGTDRVVSIAFDRANVTPEALAGLDLFCVIDAAGPFQHQPPAVARAAIAARVHYLDLADARDFVATFKKLDTDATAADVVARTGASSTPALSSVVIEMLTRDWRHIDDILVAILPGNRAPRGLSVMRSILSYVGRPILIYRNGIYRDAPGWGLMERRVVPELGARWMSLCETPDLDVIPARFAPRQSAIFKAGLELSPMHLGLWGLSWIVRVQLLRSLEPFAGLLTTVADWLKSLGTDRGGMLVEAIGIDTAGKRVCARWTLVAAAGCGPNIPTIPALAALKALHRDQLKCGAGPLVGDISYDQIASEFARFPISTRTHVEPMPYVFEIAVGTAFDRLPTPIRALHARGGADRFEGRADIDGPDSQIGRLMHWMLRLPCAGRDIKVVLAIDERCTVSRAPVERWTRTFGRRSFSSKLRACGVGSNGIEERFGLIRVKLKIEATPDVLKLAVVGWSLWRIPLPNALAPSTEAEETVDGDERFRFDISITLPIVGRLVHYRGWLVATPREPSPCNEASQPTTAHP